MVIYDIAEAIGDSKKLSRSTRPLFDCRRAFPFLLLRSLECVLPAKCSRRNPELRLSM